MRIIILAIGFILFCNCARKQDVEESAVSKEEMQEETIRYKVLAENICVCNKDLITLFKEIQGMEKEEQQQKSKELKKKIQEESKMSEACIQKLKKAYSKENVMDENLMENALKEHCNDFYNMLKIGRM